MPPGATAKALAAEFARYLGVPVTARMTQAQITEAVCHTYDRAGVRLVLIDENPPPQPPHHHRRRDRGPAERPHRTHPGDVRVRGHRRDRHTVVRRGTRGATRRTGLADRVRGLPRAARHTRTIQRVDHRRGNRPRPEAHTTRGHHRRLASYLHQRTAGRIGSLTRLIRQAAITAIDDGTERITKTSLDTVRLDHPAETHHRPGTTAGSRTPRQ
ncbi:ATP/GTP-binding protein [Embleya sp. NPDC055664]